MPGFARKYKQNQISKLDEIGSGSFGTVYSAHLQGYGAVAVKMVQSENEAYRESERLNGLDHPNILSLIGIAVRGGRIPWLILEYMPQGNLRDYVQNYVGGCPATGMILMAHGIASGMDYLHRIANLVHRDLAARNVLVGEDWNVKVGDFGLCDEYSENNDYYDDGNGRPCPIRWMPPENQPITDRKFSRKGDVWSYGVVLFEIWSRGKVPYATVSDNKKVMNVIVNGNNPLGFAKINARGYAIDIMRHCWKRNPEDRPNFRIIMGYWEENNQDIFGCSDSSSDSSY